MTMVTDLVVTIMAMTMVTIIPGIFTLTTIRMAMGSVDMIILTHMLDITMPLLMFTATGVVAMTTALLDMLILITMQVTRTADMTTKRLPHRLKASSLMTISHQKRWRSWMPQKGLLHLS
jgi:hypothetical protein